MKQRTQLLASLLILTANFSACGQRTAEVRPAQEVKPAPVEYKNPEDYTAEEIVQLVHWSRALNETALNGDLRKADQSSPVNVSLKEKSVQFTFTDQVVLLSLSDNSYKLYEAKNGAKKASTVPDAQYSVGLRGTDLTYEDISFRYLYWPKPMKLKSETFSTRKCWKIQLNNNSRVGAYACVWIWVDQESGGLMKMQGFNAKGQLIKTCKVTKGMKIKNAADGREATVLKEMTIETHDPVSGKGLGKSYLIMRQPEK